MQYHRQIKPALKAEKRYHKEKYARDYPPQRPLGKADHRVKIAGVIQTHPQCSL